MEIAELKLLFFGTKEDVVCYRRQRPERKLQHLFCHGISNCVAMVLNNQKQQGRVVCEKIFSSTQDWKVSVLRTTRRVFWLGHLPFHLLLLFIFLERIIFNYKQQLSYVYEKSFSAEIVLDSQFLFYDSPICPPLVHVLFFTNCRMM